MNACPKCKAAVAADQIYCGDCGKALPGRGGRGRRGWLWFGLGFIAGPIVAVGGFLTAIKIKDEIASNQTANYKAMEPIQYWELPESSPVPSTQAYNMDRFDIAPLNHPPEYASDPTSGGSGVPPKGGPGLKKP